MDLDIDHRSNFNHIADLLAFKNRIYDSWNLVESRNDSTTLLFNQYNGEQTKKLIRLTPQSVINPITPRSIDAIANATHSEHKGCGINNIAIIIITSNAITEKIFITDSDKSSLINDKCFYLFS